MTTLRLADIGASWGLTRRPLRHWRRQLVLGLLRRGWLGTTLAEIEAAAAALIATLPQDTQEVARVEWRRRAPSRPTRPASVRGAGRPAAVADARSGAGVFRPVRGVRVMLAEAQDWLARSTIWLGDAWALTRRPVGDVVGAAGLTPAAGPMPQTGG
jgi:hypothetical protein